MTARLLTATIILLATAMVSHAQWSTIPGAPVPSSRINDIFFVDEQRGWIASGAGVIYRTENGGVTWQLQFQKSGTHFRSIGFADEQRGWAGCLGIGDPNNPSSVDTTLIYSTTNGGATWQPEPSVSGAIPRGFCGIHVVNDTVVYGVGRVRGPAYFYRTLDGGTTWDVRDLGFHAGGLIDVYFVTVDTGFAVGLTNGNHSLSSGIVLRTTDRGETWMPMHTTPRTGEWCWKISFPSRSTGYVSLQRNSLSPIYFLKTTDGGETWTDRLFSQSYYFVQGLGFANDTLGWVGGNSTQPAYMTTDGGDSWVSVPIGRRVNRFRFVSQSVGYAAGETVYRYASSQTSVHADPSSLQAGPSPRSVGFPNPFNPSTTIRFTVAQELTTVPVTLIVYDALGREVERLVDDELEGGTYERTWNAGTAVSGAYYYRLTIGTEAETKKIVLVR